MSKPTFSRIMEFPDGHRIIALSDLHGDIEVFMKCLVMSKIISSNYRTTTVTENDIEYTLPIFDSVEWIARDIYLVIVGDILDNYRPNNSQQQQHQFVNYSDIYLLIYIDILHKKAIDSNSKVIKVLGNHEFMNINFK